MIGFYWYRKKGHNIKVCLVFKAKGVEDKKVASTGLDNGAQKKNKFCSLHYREDHE